MHEKLPAVVYFIAVYGCLNPVTPIAVEYGWANDKVVYELSRNATGSLWGTTFLRVNGLGQAFRISDIGVNLALNNEVAARGHIAQIGQREY